VRSTAGALVMAGCWDWAGRFDPLSLLGPMLVVVAGGASWSRSGLARRCRLSLRGWQALSPHRFFLQQEGTAALAALVVCAAGTPPRLPLALSLLALALMLAACCAAPTTRVDISAMTTASLRAMRSRFRQAVSWAP